MAAALTTLSLNFNYEEEQRKLLDFLQKYVPAGTHEPKYPAQLQAVCSGSADSITIDLDDVATVEGGESLAAHIAANAKRYEELAYAALDQLISNSNLAMAPSEEPVDIILQQRIEMARRDNNDEEKIRAMFPKSLLRRFAVHFKPLSLNKALAVRQANAHNIGQLIKIRGMVTRISEVRPAVKVAAYTCSICGVEVFQEVNGPSFKPVVECPSETCKKNQTKGDLTMQTRGSRFVRFQEAKIQELTDQVPMGHIPRSMVIHLYGDLTRTISPGDNVTLSGVFLPRVYTGFKAMRVGLIAETFLEAHHVDLAKKQYDQYQLTPEIMEHVNELAADPQAYEKLSKSIAPEIYGMDDVKKALMLLLANGATLNTLDGMKIRGDINILLMGDPGIAKSQLLKWTARVAPRGVYTTGKGSSGVGLTAAVTRDTVTGEMILEGGSLVLADNGICCIDEFDKMDDSDRTAIHEVMEQQTISISKAGVNTTLNARTSILAAANPAYSRYNTKKSISENVNLPPALLSRFDLLFLLLDKSDPDLDSHLAQHILHVHRHCRQPTLEFEPLEPALIRQYIAQARRFSPRLTPAVADFIVNVYVNKRREANDKALKKDKDAMFTSPRSLLALIRLAIAKARLRMSNQVTETDVTEAVRLIDAAQDSLATNTSEKRKNSPTTTCYLEIKKLAQERGVSDLTMAEIRDRLRVSGGFDESVLNETINEYETLGVWMRLNDRVTFTSI